MSAIDWMLDRLKADWVVTTLGVVTTVVVVLTFVGAALLLPDILSSTNAVRDGTELEGCRSSHEAEVTNRRTDGDLARSERDTFDADADVLLLELAEAAIFGDDERVAELRMLLAPKRRDLAAANDRVRDTDVALKEANEALQAAVAFSRSDPDGFISQCKARDL